MRILIAAALLAAGLAGCADDAAPTAVAPVAREDVQLATGKGAIAGLLLDDRFRPIELVDAGKAAGPFQAAGFVLLQETGQRVKTTANGEFTFVDLEPGRYTVRVTVAGHEATPQTVQVVKGVFNDVNVVARRVIDVGSQIVTQEYSVFIACSAYATTDCTLDGSGDTDRSGIEWDSLEQFMPDLTYAKAELRVAQPGIYCLEVRAQQLGGATDEPSYADWCVGQDGEYISGILQVGENYMQDGKDPWDPERDTQVIMFYFGNNEATCWQTEPYRCAGVGLGLRGQIVLSLFLGEPEVDLETYCVLC